MKTVNLNEGSYDIISDFRFRRQYNRREWTVLFRLERRNDISALEITVTSLDASVDVGISSLIKAISRQEDEPVEDSYIVGEPITVSYF